MTTEKWTSLVLKQNHMNKLQCYDYHIYLENKQMLYSCTFHGNAGIDNRNGLCKAAKHACDRSRFGRAERLPAKAAARASHA